MIRDENEPGLTYHQEHEEAHHHGHGHDNKNVAHHGADCGCGECRVGDMPGIVRVELRLHNEAIVVSGTLTVFAEYETVREALKAGMEDIARAVTDCGGVVGHVKASASVTRVELLSVTSEDVMVREAPEEEIRINLAAIVFLVAPEELELMVRGALAMVKSEVRK